jgi:aminoglycoside/choline kinase family phosphotransferase
MDERAEQVAEFLGRNGWAGAATQPMAGDLSPRRYLRLTKSDGSRAILMDADPAVDPSTPAYLAMTKWLAALDLSVPDVLGARENDGLLLLEDFGDAKLTGLFQKHPERQAEYYHRAIDVLIVIRNAAPKALKQPTADQMVRDTGLADEWYPGADHALLAQFQAVLEVALDEILLEKPTVSLRDFHADNVIWLDDRDGVRKVGLLDYQDAFLTHPAYDLMSLLTDARTDVPRALRAELIAHYADRTNEAAEVVGHAVAVLGAQRNLRILGIFARAARKYAKTQHLDALPRVYGYLSECMSHPAFSGFSSGLPTMLPAPDAALINGLRT